MKSAEDGGDAASQSRRGGRIKRIKIWNKMKEMIKRTWKNVWKKGGENKGENAHRENMYIKLQRA
jgi:hypothetical protein